MSIAFTGGGVYPQRVIHYKLQGYFRVRDSLPGADVKNTGRHWLPASGHWRLQGGQLAPLPPYGGERKSAQHRERE